jgi:hypothetical protein
MVCIDQCVDKLSQVSSSRLESQDFPNNKGSEQTNAIEGGQYFRNIWVDVAPIECTEPATLNDKRCDTGHGLQLHSIRESICSSLVKL